MAKLSQMIPVLAEALARDEAAVSHCARVLRDSGLISSGGRGPGGAEMTNQDATNLLIGAIGTDVTKDAPSAVVKFRRIAVWITDQPMVEERTVDADGSIRTSYSASPPEALAFLSGRGLALGDALEKLLSGARRGDIQILFADMAARFVPDGAKDPLASLAYFMSNNIRLAIELQRPLCRAKICLVEIGEHRWDAIRREHTPVLCAQFVPPWGKNPDADRRRFSIGRSSGDRIVTETITHRTIFALANLLGPEGAT